MAHVRLDNVLMPEARKLTFKAPPHGPGRVGTGDPLYAVVDRPEGKVVVLTVNLDKSDLPLQTAFPIMMTNLLGWFRGSKGELREALRRRARWPRSSCPPRPDPAPKAARLLRAPDGRETPAARRGRQGGRRPARPLRRLERRPPAAGQGRGEGRDAGDASSSWRATWPTAARATSGPPPGCPARAAGRRRARRAGRSGITWWPRPGC